MVVKRSRSYAPTSAYRWFLCPGSVPHVARLPKEPETAAAALGKAIHAVSAARLLGQTPLEADLRRMERSGLAYMSEYYVNYVSNLHERVGGRLYVEEKIRLGYSGGNAYIDAAVHNGEELHVVDLKTGSYEEDPKGEQMQIYASEFSRLLEGVKHVHQVIVQPRRMSTGVMMPVRMHRTVVRDLLSWRDEVLLPAYARAAAAETDEDKIPGYKQCKWCPAREECEPRNEWLKSDRSIVLEI